MGIVIHRFVTRLALTAPEKALRCIVYQYIDSRYHFRTREHKVKPKNKMDGFVRVAAGLVIWLLLALSVPVLLFVVPLLSVELASSYSEFSNEGLALMALIGTPVLLGQTFLGIVLLLLGRIRTDRMFSPKVNKWVRLLGWNAAALAVGFSAILSWFGAKNTLPPLVLLSLIVAILLSLAVALVTASLLGILQRATAATQELDAVI